MCSLKYYTGSICIFKRNLSRNGSLTGSGRKRRKSFRHSHGRRKSSGRPSTGLSGLSALTSSSGAAGIEGTRGPSRTSSSKSAERETLKIHKEVIEQVR